MGFPSHAQNKAQRTSSSHKMITKLAPTSQSSELESISCLSNKNYQCPQCKLYVQTLPIICPTCGLQLITSSHLARSHHHLFPIGKFEVVMEESNTSSPDIKEARGDCHGCGSKNVKLSENPVSKTRYCFDCEIFMREKLRFSF